MHESVAEAVVNAYNDDEQVTRLYTMTQEHLAVPFETTVVDLQARNRLAFDGLDLSGVGSACGQAIGIWTSRCPTVRRRPNGSPPTGTGPSDE